MRQNKLLKIIVKTKLVLPIRRLQILSVAIFWSIDTNNGPPNRRKVNGDSWRIFMALWYTP